MLGNAVKFNERGHVLFDVTDELVDETVALNICVEDTGTGTSADNLQNVFEKFAQVDGSSTHLHKGICLGLTIAARFINLMVGRIGG